MFGRFQPQNQTCFKYVFFNHPLQKNQQKNSSTLFESSTVADTDRDNDMADTDIQFADTDVPVLVSA